MLYRINPKNGDSLSQLGFGAMRLPRKGGKVDIERVTAQVHLAVEQGINYFDTAYIYPGSEEALGTALAASGLRDQVKIATKLPLQLVRSGDDFERLFQVQLKRLKTNRIDYYLLHMLGNTAQFDRLKSLGILSWIAEKKANGEIINLGFSFHGGREAFTGLIDAYAFDFCMIQYNYLDENYQAGKIGLQYASQKGLPVFVMEPLRGGLLAGGIPKKAKDIFHRANPDLTLAEWGLRWVWNHKEVTMALSGMGEPAQLMENAHTASLAKADTLTQVQLSVYSEAVGAINESIRVPCTGCGYCLPCPKGVDIPTCFACYNESYARGFVEGVKHYVMSTGALTGRQSGASRCVRCKACERHCPQHIEISADLARVKGRLESFWYRPLTALVGRISRTKVTKAGEKAK